MPSPFSDPTSDQPMAPCAYCGGWALLRGGDAICDTCAPNVGTLDAVRLLGAGYDAVQFSPRLRSRLLHAIAYLDRPLEAQVFGENRTVVPDNEAAALSMLRGTAKHLTEAAESLDAAAEFVKNLGKGVQASQLKQAANAAHRAARELVTS